MQTKLPLVVAVVTLLLGCATTPDNQMTIRAGADMRCMQQEFAGNAAQKITTRWCTSRQIFQPNRHIVRVNGQPIFDGNDRDDVRVEAQIGSLAVVATCIPKIEIMDLKSDKPVVMSTLPAELIQACRIGADESGFHRPFLRDANCLRVYSAAVGPLVGRTLPFKRTQECKVEAAGSTVFEGTFLYQ